MFGNVYENSKQSNRLQYLVLLEEVDHWNDNWYSCFVNIAGICPNVHPYACMFGDSSLSLNALKYKSAKKRFSTRVFHVATVHFLEILLKIKLKFISKNLMTFSLTHIVNESMNEWAYSLNIYWSFPNRLMDDRNTILHLYYKQYALVRTYTSRYDFQK